MSKILSLKHLIHQPHFPSENVGTLPFQVSSSDFCCTGRARVFHLPLPKCSCLNFWLIRDMTRSSRSRMPCWTEVTNCTISGQEPKQEEQK